MAPSAKDSRPRHSESEASQREQTKARLSELGGRLDSAKTREASGDDGGRRGSALGLAFRITTELVVGVVVGGLIGWQLDRWFGTTPVLLLVFFVLGVAAGILNVVRTAWEMQRQAGDAGDKGPDSGVPPDET